MSVSSVKTGLIRDELLVGNAFYNPKPIVTGGTLTSDATYYYRTFTSSGTLDVSVVALTADYIVVAGGGGGGAAFNGSETPGAGGGGGGYLSPTAQSLSVNSYTVTVGAGGAGGATNAAPGATGSNSVLSSGLTKRTMSVLL